MRDNKYPDGYAGKIHYWQAQFNLAVEAGDVLGIDKASAKLKYFIDKQGEWVLANVKNEDGTHTITEEAIQIANKFISKHEDGGIKIEGDINSLKRYVDTVSEAVSDGGMELPNNITDMFYSIEVAYQEFYGLDQDNWDTVKAGDVVLTKLELD